MSPTVLHSGWNPFLNVYNWQTGKGNGWDRFVQKIGVAPVVYDPELVESSIENVTNHLEYLGYYGSTVTAGIDVRRKTVKVNYEVKLGKRYPINEIVFDLPEGEIAADFLADTFGISRTSLRSEKAILDAAKEHHIEFEGLD